MERAESLEQEPVPRSKLRLWKGQETQGAGVEAGEGVLGGSFGSGVDARVRRGVVVVVVEVVVEVVVVEFEVEVVRGEPAETVVDGEEGGDSEGGVMGGVGGRTTSCPIRPSDSANVRLCGHICCVA